MEKVFIKGHLKSDADISAKHIENFLIELSHVCGMQIFFGPVVIAPDSYDAEAEKKLGLRPPNDVNAIIMWTYSGVQMYVFPTKDNWFTIDVYSCKPFDLHKVIQFVTEYLSVLDDVQYATQTASTFSSWTNFSTLA